MTDQLPSKGTTKDRVCVEGADGLGSVGQVHGDPAMTDQLPSKRPRFEVFFDIDRHPTRVWIFDDEFHWDAGLRVTGDFANVEDRIRFAQAICDVLNEAGERIPSK